MIRLEHLTKVFGPSGAGITAVNNVSFELPVGEICVLLGPSGCGKTTTMKMINRLIAPTSGKIYIDGRDTDRIDPIQLRRSIGYVIQQIGLFPNKTVADNICVVPDLLGWDRKKSRARAAELLELIAMEPARFMNRFPKELSGGQQQRVGVLRALAADPPVMLMDEPFGAIDPINREVIQDEFLRMQKTLRKTIIFVSHDLEEAVKMADKIAIFRAGALEQFSTPDALLANPATPFIETFLGTDRTLKRLRLIRVADAMLPDVKVVQRQDPVEKAAMLLRASNQPAILVVDADGRVDGIVSASRASTTSGICGDIAERVPATLPLGIDLRGAVALMFTHDLPLLPCVDDEGRLKGVLTYRSIVKKPVGFPAIGFKFSGMSEVGLQKAAMMRLRFSSGGKKSRLRLSFIWPWLVLIAAMIAWWYLSDLPKQILDNWDDILYLGVQHIELVCYGAGLAIVTGIPAGAILSRPAFRRSSELILQVFNLGTTVPTLAIIALCMTVLGIGVVPAIFGLWVASLLPIVRNTYTGLRNVPTPLIEAARGMGMTPGQVFWRVEFPNALFVIFGGIRTALSICVGTAPLAFLIGAGGLGDLIFTGIALNDLPTMLAGAIPTALLAVVADFLVSLLQYALVPRE